MSDVTALLGRWNEGDAQAQEQIVNAVYAQLTQIAGGYLANESAEIELQPQALVHEAYIRLIDLNRIDWQGRAHFLGVAARIMRSILIDNARSRKALKRDGGLKVTLTGLKASVPGDSTELLVLNEALEALHEIDRERATLVELRFFGGLTLDEAAEVMGKSRATVKRHWKVARGWLFQRINQPER